jgi:hypothetical protein
MGAVVEEQPEARVVAEVSRDVPVVAGHVRGDGPGSVVSTRTAPSDVPPPKARRRHGRRSVGAAVAGAAALAAVPPSGTTYVKSVRRARRGAQHAVVHRVSCGRRFHWSYSATPPAPPPVPLPPLPAPPSSLLLRWSQAARPPATNDCRTTLKKMSDSKISAFRLPR